MKLTNIASLALPAALLLGVAACGSDNNEPVPDQGGATGRPTGEEIEQYTPEQSKEYIADVATGLMGKFNAQDQKEVIDLSNYFVERYGDYELPAEFEFEADEETRTSANRKANRFNPARYMKALSRGLSGSTSELTRAAYYYTYNINFNRIKGLYRPGANEEWVRVSNSNDLIFEFTDEKGATCQLKVVASTGSSEINVSYNDDWYDWWDNEIVTEEYEYRISLPNELTATLTQGSNELAVSKVTSTVDIDGHKVNLSVVSRLANIDVVGTMNATDSQIVQNSQIKVNGELLVTDNAVVNGNNLCNIDRISEAIDDEDDLTKFIKNGSATCDINGKVQGVLNVTFTQALIDALDESWFDSYDYSSDASARTACLNAINTLKNNITGTVHFKGSKTVQATLDYVLDYYTWGYGFEYSYVPALTFGDGSSIIFEDYFDDGSKFRGVENTWNSLIDSYEKLFD